MSSSSKDVDIIEIEDASMELQQDERDICVSNANENEVDVDVVCTQASLRSVMVNSTVITTALKAAFLHSDPLYSVLLFLILISFCIFNFLMVIILSVYFMSSHMQDEPRYVLFIHMLISDTMYLTLGLFVFFVSAYLIYFPAPVCYILVTASSSGLVVTPVNLAVMCLERYVAICFPLRHAVLCTRQKSYLAIAVIWIIGLTPNLADFIILCFSVKQNFFSFYCLCGKTVFIVSQAQSTLWYFAHALTFSLVGLIIAFTYIKIMLVAVKVDSGKTSASKAGRTVILHVLQLLLCLTAFTYAITEAYLRKYLYMLPLINFFFFMCLPRCISPLIYGLRDEVFGKYIKSLVLCKRMRTIPNAVAA
ncbi:odorant receptor 131-2-like [Pseudophryne corroboree]|uniref:odorant receptor 131-2-like n=1 Tax=Pseudophryne corroboree TaxID=495146 RepID=UPI003081D269